MLGVNETRNLVLHELCEYKCGLNETVCKSKQKWNCNECQCEYNYMVGNLVKMVIPGILARVIVNVIKHV